MTLKDLFQASQMDIIIMDTGVSATSTPNSTNFREGTYKQLHGQKKSQHCQSSNSSKMRHGEDAGVGQSRCQGYTVGLDLSHSKTTHVLASFSSCSFQWS